MTRFRIVKLAMFGAFFGGFENALANYMFTTIEVPGAFQTNANGINNSGEIVGLVGFLQDNGQNDNKALIDIGGSFTTFDYPGGQQTNAYGVNNNGQVVGEYVTVGAGVFHGFLYGNGSFTSVDYPGAQGFTSARGINDSAQIVGAYYDGAMYHGFVDTGGSFVSITAPGAACPFPPPSVTFFTCGTFASGINARGDIVGSFGDAAGVTHGFLYSGGSFSIIDYLSCLSAINCHTICMGISASGQIVGFFREASNHNHAFVDNGGSFTLIQVPNFPYSATWANGTNDSGQIVGHFFGNDPGARGFLATPASAAQEPGSLPLF